MPVRFRVALLAAAIVMPALATASLAQNIIFDAPGLLTKKKGNDGLPDVKAAPLAWPRLDPGAALCRSEADLDRLAANRARTEGAGPADCQIIRVPTAIQIVSRKGPGRTQVQVTEQASNIGWTDVWLPEKNPAQNGSKTFGKQ